MHVSEKLCGLCDLVPGVTQGPHHTLHYYCLTGARSESLALALPRSGELASTFLKKNFSFSVFFFHFKCELSVTFYI